VTEWFNSGHLSSPLTNAELKDLTLVPNHALRATIQEFVSKTMKAKVNESAKTPEEIENEKMMKDLSKGDTILSQDRRHKWKLDRLLGDNAKNMSDAQKVEKWLMDRAKLDQVFATR